MVYHRSFVLILTFVVCAPLAGQQTPPTSPPQAQRDPQAIAVVTHALTAAGGASAIAAVQDFTATGNITYYWADEEVGGTVKVKHRGITKFRLDASLAGGTRAVVARDGTGFVRKTDGGEMILGRPLAVNLGSTTFPIMRLSAALQDASTSLTYLGPVTHNGQQVYEVKARMTYSPSDDSSGRLGELTEKEFFIDVNSLQVICVRDMAYLRDNFSVGIQHEVQFADFRQINGLAVPFSVTETINGQRTMAIQLNAITFNTNLTDSDFE